MISYHNQYGVYPKSVDELNIDKQRVKQYGIYYSYQDNQPYLFYKATWIMFDIYDFKTKQWSYFPL